MKELFRDYWDKIAKSPLYWIPLFVFSAVGYGFSICNRTIHIDDLLKDYYNEVTPFSGRWGMFVWGKLVGVTDFAPFVDRFVTLLFLLVVSFLMGALFYYIKNREGHILSYTVLSSMVLTYPLINEIYEYTGADIQYAGNLALMIFAFTYLTIKKATVHREKLGAIFKASLLMILPASSYEVGLFSYVTLLCAVIFYKHSNSLDNRLSLKQWLYENGYYLAPLLLAIAYRFIVHFAILFISDATYIQVGGSIIDYSNTTLLYLLGSNFFKYYVAGLVYFPITVFVAFSFVFWGGILWKSISKCSSQIVILAIPLYISIFSLAFIRGLCMDYRIAQTVTVFVAFVAFLLCEIRESRLRLVVSSALLFLCWHQAVYLNNVLSLNNMRSNNEILNLHNLGSQIISEFGNKKPVVFIVDKDFYGGYLGPWIESRLYADTNTWNGRVFDKMVKHYLPEKYHHYKYVNSNVNSVMNWAPYYIIKDFFSYCGYDINLVSFSSILKAEKDSAKRKQLDDIYKNAAITMKSLEVRDIGDCLFVKY